MNEPLKEKIPVFRSWRGWYALVLGILLGLIILFYVLTQHFK